MIFSFAGQNTQQLSLIFGMAAMPFPCNFILLIQGDLNLNLMKIKVKELNKKIEIVQHLKSENKIK